MKINIRFESDNRKMQVMIDDNSKVINLKKLIMDKTNIPIKRQKLTFKGNIMDDDKYISGFDFDFLSEIKLKIIMGAFGFQKKPPIDINTFIIDNIYDFLSDIIVFIWGNSIYTNRNLIEYKTDKYPLHHDTFRQQLPIPILEKAYLENKDVTVYSVDEGFSTISDYDIRGILINYVEPIIVDKIEFYSIPLHTLFTELEINHDDNLINKSKVNLYFIPYTYGYCKSSNDNDNTNIKLCLRELEDNIKPLVDEFYIYDQPLDIDTLITNDGNDIESFKDWFNLEGGRNKQISHKKIKLPKKYTARLSRKDKLKQKKSIKRSIKLYEKGKYLDRPKLKSYKPKKSSWVTKFEKKYGEDIKSYEDIERATKIPKEALKAVVKKGKGAYYSSGSRPNQTAESWGKARMYSYIMGGPTRKYDEHITKQYNVKLPD